MLSNRFDIMNDEERFKLANLIQTPSYISLTTALGYFDLTTQQQQQFVESIALKRSKMVTVKRISFNYTLVKDSIYHHFYLQNGFFIASPEKALVDAVYLSAMRRYKCDFHAIKFSQINVQLVDELIKNTNKKTIIHWWEICKIFKL
ncbi:hypothetical protein JW964_15495 [candidate division KSB1 bacterium]|nr:hypothetical protein [candidate division KSB1 bacterium]